MAEKKISSKAVHETVNALPGFPINIHTFEGCVEKYSICPRHWHRSLEITYRIRYKGHLFVNNRKTELVSDKVILINSGEIHEIHREPLADMRAVLIQIPYEYMKAAVQDIDDYYFSVDSDDEILKKLVLSLEEENQKREEFSHIRVSALALELLYYLMSRCSRKRTRDSQVPFMDSEWTREVLRYIQEHISEIRSVGELAAHFNYSREHFSRIFSQTFGVSCQDYLVQYRLDRAIILMAEKKPGMEKIASLTGFQNSRTFCSAFKKMYGETPQQFLKKKLQIAEEN